MAGLNSENWKVERPISKNLSNLEAFGSLRQMPSRKPDLSVASGNCSRAPIRARHLRVVHKIRRHRRTYYAADARTKECERSERSSNIIYACAPDDRERHLRLLFA